MTTSSGAMERTHSVRVFRHLVEAAKLARIDDRHAIGLRHDGAVRDWRLVNIQANHALKGGAEFQQCLKWRSDW